jgi:hypothetical protein
VDYASIWIPCTVIFELVTDRIWLGVLLCLHLQVVLRLPWILGLSWNLMIPGGIMSGRMSLILMILGGRMSLNMVNP